MNFDHSTTRKARGRNSFGRKSMLFTVAAALAFVSFGTAPASAGNELRNGFEDQVGRLLAHEVFRAGRQVLYAGHHVQHYAPTPVVHREYRVERYDAYGDHDDYDRRDHDDYDRRDHRHERSRVQPVVEYHYHYGSRDRCNAVHDRVFSRGHGHDRHRGRSFRKSLKWGHRYH